MLLTKQYDNKPENKYVTCFKSNFKAIKMEGRENVLLSEVIMDWNWFDLIENGTDEGNFFLQV